ncbi:MAG TPA: SurA N-terminal domain-containing protein [Candidatus Dormibacteraeota bacterium]|nr:SurA N-terminal domain-containing protein [Candidatus Dormibacteraeota bacterium]
MLDSMRKGADSFLVKGFYVVIVLVFVFWGVGTMRANRMEVAALVNSEVITKHQFDRAYQNLQNVYRNMGQQGAAAPPEALLRSQAIAQLVSNELLIQEAHRLGLEVDEAELRQSIASMPNFQADGHFDKDAYLEVLRQNGLKPTDFEELQRRQLLAAKVEDLVAQGAHISDAEVKERFQFDNERVSLKFVRLPAASFAPQVTLSDQDVLAYYTENQERYREPERVRIQMVEFRPADFAKQVNPTDDEIKEYYDANQAQFQKQEEVHARHILFTVKPDASEADKAAARKQAEEVLAKAKGGADFAELAKQYSQDSTAAGGGDLGSFARGVMTPPFEAAAFALEPGQVSDIVETQFGFHIIKLEEKTPARTASLEDVKPTIVEALRGRQARKVALDAVEKAHDAVLDGTPLEKVAADLGLALQSPPPFGANEKIFGLERKPLNEEAFNTEVGEIGEVITESSGYTIIKVLERIPSAVPPLDQVREKIEGDLRAKKAAELAHQRGEALLAKLKDKKSIQELAGEEKLTIEDSREVGRFGGYLPNIGTAPALKDAAFQLTLENPVAPAVYDVNGDAVIAVLDARLPPDESRFDAEKASIEERLRGQAAAAAVRTFIDQLKAKSQIEYGMGLTGTIDARS